MVTLPYSDNAYLFEELSEQSIGLIRVVRDEKPGSLEAVRILQSFGMIWFKATLIGGSIFWLAIQILGGGLSGDFAKYGGGLYWQCSLYPMGVFLLCGHLPRINSILQGTLQYARQIHKIHVG